MQKVFAVLTLAGLFAIAPLAVAQAPKADPKKPADTKPAASKGSITIKPDAKGRYRLLIKDADGKGMLMTAGNGFETEKEAREAIEELKSILSSAKVTVEKGDEKDK
ncbi:MAG: hypothetical protein MUF18_00595 [Fimbriiglobus sp.]|jgi:uncharacterized protein YegP (UPF0339 family)|nr:hypothetical protein [Fimbriiglobus sp.]